MIYGLWAQLANRSIWCWKLVGWRKLGTVDSRYEWNVWLVCELAGWTTRKIIYGDWPNVDASKVAAMKFIHASMVIVVVRIVQWSLQTTKSNTFECSFSHSSRPEYFLSTTRRSPSKTSRQSRRDSKTFVWQKHQKWNDFYWVSNLLMVAAATAVSPPYFSPGKNQSTENHKHTANRFLYFLSLHRPPPQHPTPTTARTDTHTHTTEHMDDKVNRS